MAELREKVLSCLTENARYTNKEISLIVGASETEVASIIKELEDDGTILKYGAVVNRTEESKKVFALIEVRVTPQAMYGFDKTAEELCAFEEVKTMYLMAGNFDLALFVETESMLAVANFVSEKLSQIEGVVKCSTYFVLKNYKVDGAVAIKSSDRERQIAL